MTIKAPANPAYGSAQTIAATTTPTTVTLGVKTKQLMLTNSGPGLAYVRITPILASASKADAVIPLNGMPIIYTKFEDILQISIVSDSTSSVHVMPCEGFGSF